MIGGPHRYIAIFTDTHDGQVLRDYQDEWHRDANVPADAARFDWSADEARYIVVPDRMPGPLNLS